MWIFLILKYRRNLRIAHNHKQRYKLGLIEPPTFPITVNYTIIVKKSTSQTKKLQFLERKKYKFRHKKYYKNLSSQIYFYDNLFYFKSK